MSAAAAGLLDTSAVIVLDRLDPARVPATSAISAVTLAELSVGPHVAADAIESAARLSRLQHVEAAFEVLPFDAASARTYGRIAAALRLGGRPGRARSLAVMIAATAITRGLPLFTGNPRDFDGIPELEVYAVGPT